MIKGGRNNNGINDFTDLKYLNGCLDDDHMYRIGNFIIKNYTLIENHTMVSFIDAAKCSQEELLDFCQHFGIHSLMNLKNVF